MEPDDIAPITAAEIAQGWDASMEKFQRRLQDQNAKKAIALVAEFAGTVTILSYTYPKNCMIRIGSIDLNRNISD